MLNMEAWVSDSQVRRSFKQKVPFAEVLDNITTTIFSQQGGQMCILTPTFRQFYFRLM